MYVSITSGHTESFALAYDEGLPLSASGASLVISRAGSLNLHCLNDKTLVTTLDDALDALLGQLHSNARLRGYREEDRLVLALPGIASQTDCSRGTKCVLGSKWPSASSANFCVIDDTFAGLIAGSLSTKGICAFAGTGASVYFGTSDGAAVPFFPGKPYKLDGCGPMLGDFGSAFRVGMSTLERIGRYFDQPPHSEPTSLGGLPTIIESILFELLGRRWSADYTLQNCFDELMANNTPDWRFQIARLATVLTSAAEQGDPFAKSQLDDAARELATTIGIGLDLDVFSDMRSAVIYGQGGMFRHSPYYRERVLAHLDEMGWKNPLQLAKYAPSVGALLIAASPNWTVPNPSVVSAIEEDVKNAPSEAEDWLFNTRL